MLGSLVYKGHGVELEADLPISPLPGRFLLTPAPVSFLGHGRGTDHLRRAARGAMILRSVTLDFEFDEDDIAELKLQRGKLRHKLLPLVGRGCVVNRDEWLQLGGE